MEKYKTKSMLLCRAKNYNVGDDTDLYPYFIQLKLFKINDPHKTTERPIQIFEFRALSAYFHGFKEVKFLPWGNDVLYNDLTEIQVEFKNDRLYVTNLSK